MESKFYSNLYPKRFGFVGFTDKCSAYGTILADVGWQSGCLFKFPALGPLIGSESVSYTHLMASPIASGIYSIPITFFA